MASEVLQILNLSPIPELSEMELSTVLEQLSGLSDQNGEVTDRNVEEILREAEGLIDTSISVKTESTDSKTSFAYQHNSRKEDEDKTDKNLDIKSSEFDKELKETEEVAHSSKESTADVLKLSMTSGCNTPDNGKSECTLSNKSKVDSSEVPPTQSPKSMTNHIQSTLISLREYSKKIENKKKESSQSTEEQKAELVNELPSNISDFSCATSEQKPEILTSTRKSSKFDFGAASEKTSRGKKSAKQVVSATKKSVSSDNSMKNKKGLGVLSLNESIKTLDCFERLYRGKSAQGESKQPMPSERHTSYKRTSSMKTLKTKNPSISESIHKMRKPRRSDSLLLGKRVKTYDSQEFDASYNYQGENKKYSENIIDEEISYEKCLQLLNEESESQNNLMAMTSLNYTELAEKMLKVCTASVSALQGEVEDLKSQMKRNEGPKGLSLDVSKGNFVHQFCSQENVVQVLKEENSKLFKEIEEIKEQLKTNARTSMTGSCRTVEKVEVVEKLRLEVENLRRSLITAYSENNGISRLEEQFSLLKRKYDQQIGKLEDENRKLKDVLARGGNGFDDTLDSFRRIEENRNAHSQEVGVQTDGDNWRFRETEWKTRRMVRSASLENCRKFPNAYPFASYSCENVDVATSPMRTDRELCSVSVQCEGESMDGETDQPAGRRRALGQFHRLENKENVKRFGGKMRTGSNAANQALKQKKLSDHENELMVTVRSLHSEITVKDRDNKKLRNELEAARNQIKRLTVAIAKYRNEDGKKFFHIGTQTIGLNPKIHEEYDPVMFQVSSELESENEELKSRLVEMEKVVDLLKEKRIRDLQILQKLHEEEIDKLASRLNTQTALTNHLHSLLTNR